jgi:hypothetical protein
VTSAPLFTTFGREKEESELPMPVGKIYNSPAVPVKEKNDDLKFDTSRPKPEEKDEDEWGAVPSFLRRPKIK